MVGPPKSLEDLRRVEAAVEVRCHSCSWREVRDLEELIAQIRGGGGNTSWQTAHWSLSCGNAQCRLKTIGLKGLPFAKAPVLPRRRFEGSLIALALQALDPSKRTPPGKPKPTIEVRLALRVLLAFLGRSTALTRYWQECAADPGYVWQSCHHPYDAIRLQLIQLGWDLDCGGARWRGR